MKIIDKPWKNITKYIIVNCFKTYRFKNSIFKNRKKYRRIIYNKQFNLKI